MSDEILDVVNDDDQVVAQETRSAVHARGLWHRGAHVFLFTSDGKMLLQQRSKARSLAPSLWDGSVSEHVKAGESYAEAAMRGLKEEMGVDGIELKPLVKFSMNYGLNDNEVSLLFEGKVDSALVSFDPIEVDAVKYLRVSEIENETQNNAEKYCPWFVQMMNWYLNKPSKLKINSA